MPSLDARSFSSPLVRFTRSESARTRVKSEVLEKISENFAPVKFSLDLPLLQDAGEPLLERLLTEATLRSNPLLRGRPRQPA
jgi:hypothetical protein